MNSLQLDPGNNGKISAGDAAQFLKKSGLSDSTLGKVGHSQRQHVHRFDQTFQFDLLSFLLFRFGIWQILNEKAIWIRR